MAVYKEEIRKQYCKVPMEYLKNKSLSLKELGLLVKIYALPENWDFSLEGLAKTMDCGVSQIRSTFQSLIAKGFIRINRVRGPDGRFIRTDLYILIDPVASGDPSFDFPQMENPQVEKPTMGSPQKEKRRVEKQPEEKLSVENHRESIYKESKNNESIMKESIMKRSTGTYAQRFRKKNAFNNFEQRDYNFDVLEKQLLQAQDMEFTAKMSDVVDTETEIVTDEPTAEAAAWIRSKEALTGEVMTGV